MFDNVLSYFSEKYSQRPHRSGRSYTQSAVRLLRRNWGRRGNRPLLNANMNASLPNFAHM